MLIFYNNNGHTYEITEERGKKGLESTSGVILYHPVYDSIENFKSFFPTGKEMYNYRLERNGKYGLVQVCNLELTELLPIEYDNIVHIKTEYFLFAIVWKDGKCGLFLNETWFLEQKYDNMTVVTYGSKNADQYLLIEKDRKYGILFLPDLNEVPIEFDEILPPTDEFGIRAKRNGVWGHIGKDYKFTSDLHKVRKIEIDL